jgi:hypothetical protein
MKSTSTLLNYFLVALLFCKFSVAQQMQQGMPILCKTSEAMKAFYKSNPEAQKEKEAFEKYTQEFAENFSQQKNSAICYVIPVVFHVYGTTQGGYPVNLSIIQGALNNWVNKDFRGLNTDYATVHSQFQSIRGLMPDITFALAQLDPNGNPTTGVVNHTVTSGFGNGTGYDNIIASHAWNNYKYMNVYIMNDLYNNNVTNNSGVAWYPNTAMSNANTARVVYNGAYLGVNCNSWQPEFASVLTHEFGHWLNLIHTFDGGCVAPNDNVADTPPCNYSGQSYGCHTSGTANAPLNCTNNLINAENYMDYSGASGCYKMFTQGQVTRMYAALQHPARQPLWQQANLVATGLGNLCSTTNINAHQLVLKANAYPNPTDGKITLELSLQKDMVTTIEIKDVLGRVVYTEKTTINAGDTKKTIDFGEQNTGAYFLSLSSGSFTKTIKLLKK